LIILSAFAGMFAAYIRVKTENINKHVEFVMDLTISTKYLCATINPLLIPSKCGDNHNFRYRDTLQSLENNGILTWLTGHELESLESLNRKPDTEKKDKTKTGEKEKISGTNSQGTKNKNQSGVQLYNIQIFRGSEQDQRQSLNFART